MDKTLHERLPYASRAVNVLSAIALHGYNLSIDHTTTQRWSAAMRAMRITDSYADQANKPDRFNTLLGFVENFDINFPELSAEQLGAIRYSKLIRGAATIIKTGEHLRIAKTPADYIAIRAREAAQTADIISGLATDCLVEQPNYHTRFVPAIRRLTTGAGFVDTALDAVRDFQEGTLAFAPTIAFRSQLLGRGFAELAHLTPILAKPPVVRAIGKLMVQAWRSEQLKNSVL